ncbi:MAG: hypothetical protein C0466_01790 [Candidatus Accumulibacter sp.]|nr:hypothetical protein [Accumulibacter sp.]
MLIYLGLCAVACFAGSLLLLQAGEVSVLASAHLVFALGIVPLIFGAITHFLPVLTRSGHAQRTVLLAPLILQGVGLVVFLAFQGRLGAGALHGAASSALLVALAFAAWLIQRAQRTLGKPHPGWRWYLAAIALFALALLAVLPMAVWPEARQSLRLIHLHLNSLGFVGLTAIGTLQVLLPTVLSGPDAEAAERLRRDLWLAAGGVLAAAFGAALWLPLALLGALSLAYVALRLARAWLRRYGWRTIAADGAAAALGGALLGFVGLLLLGVLHACGILAGRDAVPAFIAGFLLPLVTGALSQLLPVWRWPGPRSPARERMRAVLVAGGAARAAFFLAAGGAFALGSALGFWLAAAGLLLFVAAAARAFFSR